MTFLIRGAGKINRVPADAGDPTALLSTRLELNDGAQNFVQDHDDLIRWDEEPDWNDLGFDSAGWTSSNGKLNLTEGMDGEYHIDAMIQLQGTGDGAFTTGTMDLQIVASGASIIEHQTVPLTIDTYPRASVSTSHRIYAGGFIQIAVRVSGADTGGHFWFGSLVVRKMKSIPPVE